MMKKRLNILLLATMALMAGFTSCGNDDDFTASIFDINDYPLDRTQYSFPLDTFLKVNYLEPYNVSFIYRMEDVGSDMDKNLTPAAYDKSLDLAVLSKYLWYDVYEKYGTAEFLKKNSPRIIHVIGSKSYNPSQGTETLGVAEGGLKITLYNVNRLNPADIDYMNEYFFKTMHHEFGHILDQTVLRPTAFNLLSNSSYDASTWSDTPDSVAAGRGFVSPYASSAAGEDWVETLANYVTMDTLTWERLMGAAAYEWELIDCDSYSDYVKRAAGAESLDTVGYYKASTSGSDNKIYRRVCKRNADDTVALDDNGRVQWQHNSGIDGVAIINQKLTFVRDWLKTNWNINLDDLRREVQKRQFVTNPDGSFVYDKNGLLINKLTYPSDNDPSKTLIEVLRDGVNQYKSLQ